ncbi:hypothetical protein, partial [Borrelia persica]|uniref:hypothetical protein n=1 Tax=Borrelia persica TaxID=44448 RepID=UPI0004656EEA
MNNSIFFSQFIGHYHGCICSLVEESGLAGLLPYKVVMNKSDLRDGCYVHYKIDNGITSSDGGNTNDDANISILKEFCYKMHLFDTVLFLSHDMLMNGNINDNNIKDSLGRDLIKSVYYSVVFGNPSINMEGIATLSGRSKLTPTQASSLTTGTMLYEKVVEAKRKSEEYKEKLNGVYQLILPYRFSHLLLDLYSEPQYITVKDALLK